MICQHCKTFFDARGARGRDPHICPDPATHPHYFAGVSEWLAKKEAQREAATPQVEEHYIGPAAVAQLVNGIHNT